VGALRRILDSAWTYYAAAALLVVAAGLSALRFPSRPAGSLEELRALQQRDDVNVLFVLIDTLRADRLGAYGYERTTSPLLDSLAATGVRFARVEAQSTWTKASMASLWTSLYPVRTGVTRFAHALPSEAVMPAERLREAGFRTAGIWRNHWVANNFGFAQGFETYYEPKPSRPSQRFRRNKRRHRLTGTDVDATEAALEFMRTYGDERFFLYVHYMDVHQYLYDQIAADRGFGSTFSDAYDASIHWVDRHVGRLLQELEERELFEKTLVVVASDHGEAFYEHGGEGHARNLYREVTEVPLILAFPFRLDPGVVVEPLVRNVDIWPTLFDLLGLPPAAQSDGRSLVPLIEAAIRGEEAVPAPDDEATAFAFLDQNWTRAEMPPKPLVSVRTDAERLLLSASESERLELYDHREDPREQHNLAETQPERLEALRRRAEAFLASEVAWQGGAPEVEIDEMRRGQLQALGYVIEDDDRPRRGAEERAPEEDSP
jgi:arylsulfatase A-like enzyme